MTWANGYKMGGKVMIIPHEKNANGNRRLLLCIVINNLKIH
jgi:hypothetical protein